MGRTGRHLRKFVPLLGVFPFLGYMFLFSNIGVLQRLHPNDAEDDQNRIDTDGSLRWHDNVVLHNPVASVAQTEEVKPFDELGSFQAIPGDNFVKDDPPVVEPPPVPHAQLGSLTNFIPLRGSVNALYDQNRDISASLAARGAIVPTGPVLRGRSRYWQILTGVDPAKTVPVPTRSNTEFSIPNDITVAGDASKPIEFAIVVWSSGQRPAYLRSLLRSLDELDCVLKESPSRSRDPVGGGASASSHKDGLRGGMFRKIPIVVSVDSLQKDLPAATAEVLESYSHLISKRLYHPPPEMDLSTANALSRSKDKNREYRVTRGKHHIWWLMHQVWDKDAIPPDMDFAFFVEEDTILSPSLCSFLPNLLRFWRSSGRDNLGVNLGGDVREVWRSAREVQSARLSSVGFGIPRTLWTDVLRPAVDSFCTYDDYNWDWTVRRILKGRLFLTPMLPRIQHTGVCSVLHPFIYKGQASCDPSLVDYDGMMGKWKRQLPKEELEGGELPRAYLGWFQVRTNYMGNIAKANGGWSHPYDHMHCKQVLNEK